MSDAELRSPARGGPLVPPLTELSSELQGTGMNKRDRSQVQGGGTCMSSSSSHIHTVVRVWQKWQRERAAHRRVDLGR